MCCQGYWWVSVLLVAWYSRSYFDRAQFHTGRAWNWSTTHHSLITPHATRRLLPAVLVPASLRSLIRASSRRYALHAAVVCLPVRFRQNHLWYLAHQYCELELVRTAKLDPTRKYIFAVYPHGILIISRIGLYGGTSTDRKQSEEGDTWMLCSHV